MSLWFKLLMLWCVIFSSVILFSLSFYICGLWGLGREYICCRRMLVICGNLVWLLVVLVCRCL